MKYLILVIALIAPFALFSQLTKVERPDEKEVGRVKRAGKMQAKLTCYQKDNDTIYVLVFKNDKYQSISSYESISFIETGGTKESLFNALAEAYNAPKKTKSTFRLGEEEITLMSDRYLGTKYVTFLTDHGFFRLQAGEVSELFGRN